MKNFFKNNGYWIILSYFVLALFDMRIGLIAIICMLAPILFAIFGKGRYWCGNFCPRGNFYDRVVSKFGKKKPTPEFFKSVWFRTLMIIFIMANFTFGIINNFGNLAGMGMVFYRIIVVTTIVAIILSLFFNPRTWCSFCPMGSMSAGITKLRGRNLNMGIQTSCVSCGKCNRSCPMGIDVKSAKGGVVENIDCILCGQCELVCPKKSIYEDYKSGRL